jgi:dTDP-4-amino-4,6-dideoxygalactose transaminase
MCFHALLPNIIFAGSWSDLPCTKVVAGDTIVVMIPLHCSFITRKDMDTVLGCLITDSIGPGDYTEKFLKNAKDVFQYDTAVALRSPANALQSALKHIRIQKGGRVALSPLAPVFHKQVVEDLGFEEIYYDHNPQTMEIIIGEEVKRSSALVLYEPFGIIPDKILIQGLEIPIIEDMSQGLGAVRGDTRSGSIGNLCLYAMEQGSLVTTGGGALLFSGRRDASIIRSIAESLPREISLTDYNAALGLAKLKDFPDSLARRKELEFTFRGELARTRHKGVFQLEDGETGRAGFPVVLESGMRDVIVHAKKQGVETAPAFESSIISLEDFPRKSYPGSSMLAMRCLLFPLHEKISAKDLRIILKTLATLP